MDSLGPLRKFYELKAASAAVVAAPVKRDWINLASTIKAPTSGAALLEMVSKVTGVSLEDMKSTRRHIKTCRARHIFFAVAKEFTTLSHPQMGLFVGGRDHSTAMHGVAKVAGNREFFEPEISVCRNLAAEIVSTRNRGAKDTDKVHAVGFDGGRVQILRGSMPVHKIEGIDAFLSLPVEGRT